MIFQQNGSSYYSILSIKLHFFQLGANFVKLQMLEALNSAPRPQSLPANLYLVSNHF